jgi:hypothetical protein
MLLNYIFLSNPLSSYQKNWSLWEKVSFLLYYPIFEFFVAKGLLHSLDLYLLEEGLWV